MFRKALSSAGKITTVDVTWTYIISEENNLLVEKLNNFKALEIVKCANNNFVSNSSDNFWRFAAMNATIETETQKEVFLSAITKSTSEPTQEQGFYSPKGKGELLAGKLFIGKNNSGNIELIPDITALVKFNY